jgi:DNA recombination protein RmuC
MSTTLLLVLIGLLALALIGMVVWAMSKISSLSQVLSVPVEVPVSAEEQKRQIEALVRAATGDAFQVASQNLLTMAKQELGQQKELSKREVEAIIKPLSESVNAYKKELTDLEALRNKDHGDLRTLLKTVHDTNQILKTETHNLVSALKRPTVRGRWGEMQLRRIVELSGMSAHCDFTEQVSVESEEGRLRPDLIINLPNKRCIVVDSKAVLSGYLDAEEASDETVRKVALQRHALSVKTRIQELSRKNYWEQFENAPEFVVLFIPGEAFFSAALTEAPDLVELGFEQRVVLSTPSTLMALLKAVAMGWRQEQLAENSKRIAEQAGRLYQALGVWTQHLSQVGGALEKATKSYNAAVGSLERSVLPPARKLHEMGVTSKEEIPEPVQVELTIRELGVGPLKES